MNTVTVDDDEIVHIGSFGQATWFTRTVPKLNHKPKLPECTLNPERAHPFLFEFKLIQTTSKKDSLSVCEVEDSYDTIQYMPDSTWSLLSNHGIDD